MGEIKGRLIDFNRDGIPDRYEPGVSTREVRTPKDRHVVERLEADPVLAGPGGREIPLKLAPRGCRNERHFFDYIYDRKDTPNLRFFSSDRYRSFAPGQRVAIMDSHDQAGEVMTLSGLTFGFESVGLGMWQPIKDRMGHVRVFGYELQPQKKSCLQADMEQLVWVTKDGNRIDPRKLVRKDVAEANLSPSEKLLRPLFISAMEAKLGLLAGKGRGKAIRWLDHAMKTWRRQGKTETITEDKPLWIGIRFALGHVLGLDPMDLMK